MDCDLSNLSTECGFTPHSDCHDSESKIVTIGGHIFKLLFSRDDYVNICYVKSIEYQAVARYQDDGIGEILYLVWQSLWTLSRKSPPLPDKALLASGTKKQVSLSSLKCLTEP
jgi:hypothetical protein